MRNSQQPNFYLLNSIWYFKDKYANFTNKFEIIRSILLILFLIFCGNSFTQKSNNRTYLELNSGIAVFEEFGYGGPLSGNIFPGLSFFIGNQNFIFQNIFFESQIGLALPSIVTAKIGLGFINKGIGASRSKINKNYIHFSIKSILEIKIPFFEA